MYGLGKTLPCLTFHHQPRTLRPGYFTLVPSIMYLAPASNRWSNLAAQLPEAEPQVAVPLLVKSHAVTVLVTEEIELESSSHFQILTLLFCGAVVGQLEA